ncbi:MAG: HIT family protein [Candidatus Hodarchaeales archaeon]
MNDPTAIEMTCPFCQLEPEKVILENDLSFAIYDSYPVSPGHVLILPKRHFASYFDSTSEERISLFSLLDECKRMIDRDYNSPGGYNIGINCGEVAGQTVMHLHIHLIPRYKGDLDNPRGGVRGVIPSKRIY